MIHAGRSRELLLLLGLFAAVCWPLISSLQTSNFGFDELNYHLPAVRKIADKWPALDLREDSLSATAPGYHYFLATVAQIFGDGMRRMRIINWCVSAGLLAMVYLYARRYLNALDASLLVTPFAASNFFIKSASWVVTDNAALVFVAWVLFKSFEDQETTGQKLRISFGMAAAVFVRQLTVWLALLPLLVQLSRWKKSGASSFAALTPALLMAVPAASVLAAFYFSWGGLVPPLWNDASVRFSTAGPIYLLSVFAIFGLFYLPTESLRKALTPAQRRGTLIALGLGVLFSFTSETTLSYTDGRWGGYLWNLATKFPFVGAHSLLFAALCGLGVTAIFLFWRHLHLNGEIRGAVIFAGGFAVWASTFLINRQIFHRYFEPTALLFLIAIAPFLFRNAEHDLNWRRRMLVCGVFQICVTFYTAHASVLFDR